MHCKMVGYSSTISAYSPTPETIYPLVGHSSTDSDYWAHPSTPAKLPYPSPIKLVNPTTTQLSGQSAATYVAFSPTNQLSDNTPPNLYPRLGEINNR